MATSNSGFVGRQSELAVLADRLAAAQTGHPQVVYVEGEAGGGQVDAPFPVPWLADERRRPRGRRWTRRRRCSRTGSSISCSPGASTEPGTDPMAVGARLLDLFDRLQGDGQVVVLVIDDLQWADRPSSRAVLFALRRLRADKVLAVVSTRAGELADPGWVRFVGGDSRVTRMRLGGLSPGDLDRAGERRWAWGCCRSAGRPGWRRIPKATPSTAGRCSTRSAWPG